MRVEERTKAVQEADGPVGGGAWGGGRGGLPQGGLESPEEDVEDGAGGPGPVVEEGFEALGDREHELAHRDVVGEVGGGLGQALGVTGGAGPSSLAGKLG